MDFRKLIDFGLVRLCPCVRAQEAVDKLNDILANENLQGSLQSETMTFACTPNGFLKIYCHVCSDRRHVLTDEAIALLQMWQEEKADDMVTEKDMKFQE